MTRTRRLVIIAAALVVVVIAAVILSSSGSSNDKTSSGPQTVVVKNAKPDGGIKKITYKKGDTIDLKVTSDTADEVHFHGYDVHKDVAKGGTVEFKMPATIEGKFIVELENHKQTLANVEVQP